MRKNWMDFQTEILGKITAEQDKWLRKNVDLDTGNLRAMSTEEIRKRFPGKPKPAGASQSGQVSTVDDARLMRTFIWQSYLLIKSKELEPVMGNMRSFWYKEEGPFWKEHGIFESDEGPDVSSIAVRDMVNAFSELEYRVMDDDLRAGDMERIFKGQGRELYLTDKMSKIFDEFVLLKFFRFQDEFKFQDPREAFSIIGKNRPRYIFFTEKEGLFWFCKEIAKTHGITAVASHGEPGYLTMEYFADALRARRVKNVEIGTLTDWDPWGYNIAGSFGEKLGHPVFGFDSVNTTRLTSLKLFTEETIAKKKRDLTQVSQSKLKQVDEWFKITGGIDGKKYGMHIDNAEFTFIRDAVTNWLKQVSKRK